MSFLNAKSLAYSEVDGRTNGRDGLLKFGLTYLDDAMAGVLPSDLVLVGAPSGSGKTQLCVNIAKTNIEQGKRVHFIALEAELYEIERRIKYQLFAKNFFNAKDNFYSLKKNLMKFTDDEADRLKKYDKIFSTKINFQNWSLGDYIQTMPEFELAATRDFVDFNYQNLFTFYKTDKFDVDDLIMRVCEVANETDLIIVDHAHYFDYDDDKENKAIKEIAKTARMLALENRKPIILVSHLRKKDKSGTDLIPGIEEFHGSSDIYKIATKAITLAPGDKFEEGKMQTYLRIVKNRYEGSVTRYAASIDYLFREGKYEEKYKIGSAYSSRNNGFEELGVDNIPAWAEHADRTPRSSFDDVKNSTSNFKNKRGSKDF